MWSSFRKYFDELRTTEADGRTVRVDISGRGVLHVDRKAIVESPNGRKQIRELRKFAERTSKNRSERSGKSRREAG